MRSVSAVWAFISWKAGLKAHAAKAFRSNEVPLRRSCKGDHWSVSAWCDNSLPSYKAAADPFTAGVDSALHIVWSPSPWQPSLRMKLNSCGREATKYVRCTHHSLQYCGRNALLHLCLLRIRKCLVYILYPIYTCICIHTYIRTVYTDIVMYVCIERFYCVL